MCEKKALSLFGSLIFVGCNLEWWEKFITAWFWFCGLVICSLLVHCNFWIWFVALSLVCAQFVFGICEPLVFLFVFGSLVLYLWSFGFLIRIWFFGFVFVRESYLGVFEIWVCESTSTLILLSQICYNEICSSSPVDVSYCRTT